MEVTTVIEQVSMTPGTGKNGKPYKRYGVKTHEGWMTTFDEATGVCAEGLKGGTAIINYTIKDSPDGKYTNMTIDHIKAGESAPTTQTPSQTPQNRPQSHTAADLTQRSICMSYGKDIVVALIAKDFRKDTDDLANEISKLGDELFFRLTQTDPQKPNPDDDPMAGLGSDIPM